MQNLGIGMPAIAGPRPLPVIGRRGRKLLFYHDPIAYHRQVHQTYGRLAAFIEGGNKLLVYGPEYNRQVFSQPDLFLADPITLPGSPDSVLYRLSAGLPGMNGQQHRNHRRLLQPAFHRQHVETYRDTMVGVARHFLDRWSAGQTLDIAAQMHEITLCIASETLFGVSATDDAGSLAYLIARWIDLNANRAVHMFPVDVPGTPFRRLLRFSACLEAHIRSLIRHKRDQGAGQHDALALLLQAQSADGTPLTEDELLGHTTVLFLTGFETTAIALTWTLFLLAQHPQVMGDLVDELTSALHGDAPTIEQLRRLPLLDRVISESLRLLPPSIQGSRVAALPFSMGGYEFPAGAKVMYSEFITHHMPELYAQPDTFLPQRWCDIEPDPYAYIPFLGGARRCLGAEVAMLELKIVLSLVLQRYRLALAPNACVDYAVRFMLAPKDGLPMRILPQDRRFAKTEVRGTIRRLVALS